MTARLPLPALVATHAGVWRADETGHVASLGRGEAMRAAADTPHLMLNAAVTGSRLGYPECSGLDLLELFAFLHPARFLVPTVRGLAQELGLEPVAEGAAEAAFLGVAAAQFLARVQSPDWTAGAGAHQSLSALSRLRWPWAPWLEPHIAAPDVAERGLFQALPKWEETPPRTPPRPISLSPKAIAARLAQLTGQHAEVRQGQQDYAQAVAHSFAPRDPEQGPRVTLAQAGTGIGKTLGYLTPASLWAEQAQGTVWISTYTKALQRQLDQEASRIFPDPAHKADHAVVRKGRENYMCLLNLEDAVQGGFGGRAAIFAQLAARWARYTRDGDMVGGDLPGWLPTLFGRNALPALTDRRGECVYAGCPHFRSCFIERASRASQHADIVIANHALVMINAARGRADTQHMTRLIFDEGHHLFDAADSCFSLALSGSEAIELRRWLLGPQKKTRGRRRGLSARLSDILAFDEQGGLALEELTQAARALPADQWLTRILQDMPEGPIEALLAQVRATVLARAAGSDMPYSLETEIAEPPAALISAAAQAIAGLARLLHPMARLAQRLRALLEEAPDWLDVAARARAEAGISGLDQRRTMISGWCEMLARIGGPADPQFIDWMALERVDSRELDVGLYRHWLDPMQPFAQHVLHQSHGALITSATLLPRGLDEATGWHSSERRTGVAQLGVRAAHFRVDSPFDYAANARVLIVTDIKRGDVAGLAHGYANLIEAAGGGTLGLFTAIARLRAVHARIADRLARAGLPLYAQHVDPIDTGTLVDMFRADDKASLLGTDALRDGVDVPGRSLRLVVMEGVPWPRPTVLHAARRAHFGGRQSDDRVAMDRLAQAFGRLIRTQADRGLFILLGAAVPSRLLAAFPPGLVAERVGLEAACQEVRHWLARPQLTSQPAYGREAE